jgi:hypothetical protein
MIARDREQWHLDREKTAAGSTQVALRIPAFIAVLIAGLAWHLCGYAQDKPNASIKIPSENSNVSCYELGTGKLVRPNKRRTFVLESPDGTFRAYAQTEALLDKNKSAQDEEDAECENTSRAVCGRSTGSQISAGDDCVAQA